MNNDERRALTAVEAASAKWGSEGVLSILDALEEVAAVRMRSHLQERRTVRMAMTAQEAAKALSVSVSTVYKLAESGGLPTLRMGRSLRFPVEALQRYVEVHTTYPRGQRSGGSSWDGRTGKEPSIRFDPDCGARSVPSPASGSELPGQPLPKRVGALKRASRRTRRPGQALAN